MAKLERVYVVPLREGTQKAPAHRRAKKAVNVLKEFIAKHMKCENVKVGVYLNELIWSKGIKNPPAKVEVKAVKDSVKENNKEVEFVTVELNILPKKAEKVEAAKKEAAKKAPAKKEAPKVEKATEDKKEEPAKKTTAKKATKKVVKKVVKKAESSEAETKKEE